MDSKHHRGSPCLRPLSISNSLHGAPLKRIEIVLRVRVSVSEKEKRERERERERERAQQTHMCLCVCIVGQPNY